MNINKIAEIINQKGYQAEVHEIVKGSSTRTAIVVGDGTVRPTIYPECYTGSDEEIADKVIEIYENNKTPNFDTSNIMKEDYIKENAFVTVRRPIIDNSYTKSFLDLQLVLNVKVSVSEDDEFTSYKVSKKQAEVLGLTEDIFDEAINNTRFRVSTMGETIKSIAPDEEIPDCGLYIVSNERRTQGAAAIYNMELFKSFAEKLDSDLVIIPSSVHELIVMKYVSGISIYELNNMVKEVNETQVLPEEQLSDHVYIFNRSTNSLTY